MAKSIGFFIGVGTSLSIAMLWFALADTPFDTATDSIAEVESATDEVAADGESDAGRQATRNDARPTERRRSIADDVPQEPVSKISALPSSEKAAARRLLYQARRLALQGKIGSARELARRANALAVDWSASEQSPQNFLDDLKPSPKSSDSREVAAADEKRPATGEPIVLLEAAEPSQVSNDIMQLHLVWPTAKERAAKLLEQARVDSNAGRRDDARAKVALADEMDVVYTLFDDRPELVLQEIGPPAIATRPKSPKVLVRSRQDLQKKRFELLESLGEKQSGVAPAVWEASPSSTENRSKGPSTAAEIVICPRPKRTIREPGNGAENDRR